MNIMLILLIILILISSGCSSVTRKPLPETNKRQQSIINCTNQFLEQNLTGESAFKICEKIYERKD